MDPIRFGGTDADSLSSAAEPQPSLRDTLDRAQRLMLEGAAEDGMHLLIDGLRDVRQRSGSDWPNRVAHEVMPHPVCALVNGCPFTRHAHAQPRGYAGDAELMDYIYGLHPASNAIPDEISRRIHAVALQSAAPRAVRHRRERLAAAIDEAAERHVAPQVLAIAAGHLREWHLSHAARAGAVASFVALDQDPSSVSLVHAELGSLGVSAVKGSVRELLAGRRIYRDRTLTYAAGLFDYLPDPTARRLVHLMHDTLTVGGRMLIANFQHDIRDVGYMESFMRWHLIYRSVQQTAELFDGLPAASRATLTLDEDPARNVVYAQVMRA